jgi:choline dehydrogenase-like flavoprotein
MDSALYAKTTLSSPWLKTQINKYPIESNSMTLNPDYDAIVIGTGPGGGIVARDLVDRGKRVLILERGDNNSTKGTLPQMMSRGWIPGTQMPVTYSAKPIIRGITTGGTSNFYTATAYPPDYDLLDRYGIDIRSEVVEITKELPIGPIDDRLMSPAATLFMRSARELGYDCKKFDKYIYQERCLQNCDSCILGCPNEAKWNARMLIDEAVEKGATFIHHATVKRVLVEDNTAIGVQYSSHGKTQKVFAQTIIMSAGGIGSPLILRQSGFEGVGENICGDPLMVVCGEVKGLEGTGKAPPMMTGFHLKEEGIMLSDLHMPRVLKSLFDLHAFNFNKMNSFTNVIPIMVKVRDELSGKIINNGLVNKPITTADKAKLALGESIAQKILRQAGATETYSSRVMSAHPSGSVKIGEHVDSNLQTKYKNLYVCDSSVYPEPLGLPPSLTILGLGRRLVNHLTQAAGLNPSQHADHLAESARMNM